MRPKIGSHGYQTSTQSENIGVNVLPECNLRCDVCNELTLVILTLELYLKSYMYLVWISFLTVVALTDFSSCLTCFLSLSQLLSCNIPIGSKISRVYRVGRPDNMWTRSQMKVLEIECQPYDHPYIQRSTFSRRLWAMALWGVRGWGGREEGGVG